MIFKTQILAHKVVAEGTHEVVLSRPESFSFTAGQYVQLQLDRLQFSDHKGNTRLFSIASSPYNMEEIKVVFRSSDSGFKRTLLSLPVGAAVTVEQAAGSFVLPSGDGDDHVFVAGGVGISPFMSYFRQRQAEDWQGQVTLVYGNRSPEHAPYLEELQQLAVSQPWFSLQEIYERPEADTFAHLASLYEGATFWVVGPPAMVAVVDNGLRLGGVAVADIRTESFEGY